MITLDENYRIETDTNNFILKYEKPTGEIHKKTGKEIISSGEWYYPKLSQALDKYLNESLRPSKDIDQLKDRLTILETIIARLTINN